MPSPRQRKANNALGICVVSSVMLLETVIADHKMPNAASPVVWAVLGAVAVASLVFYFRFRDRGGERKD